MTYLGEGSQIPFINKGEIAGRARELLNECWDGVFPVDVEKVCDYLGIAILPVAGLADSFCIDAFISADFKTIYVDAERFGQESYRYRFSVAHELGHSMHSFYSNSFQEYHYADYEIFVAEVASTTNEILLSEHLLRQAESREERAYLYGHLLDEIRGTIYRQTMFAEFELSLHRKAEAGVPLTADELTNEYYELNRLYYGDAVRADPLIGLEWARIPHFYYDFYVYKYATGMSAALVLAKNLLSGDEAKCEAYLGFLRAGDSKDVLDIMKDAGVDLSTPAPVASALDYFGETVEKLERELGL